MTTEELGSAIRSGINDALKGEINDVSYNQDQLIDEAFLLRSKLIGEDSEKNKKNFRSFYQTLDSIPIHETDISNNAIIKSGICIGYIEFPAVAPMFFDMGLDYIGMNNKDGRAKSFTIYYDEMHSTHVNRVGKTRKNPYVYVDLDVGANGMIKAYLYNMGSFNDKQYLTVKGIFDNPRDIGVDDCCFDSLKDEFPAPGRMQALILELLTKKYIDLYRRANIPEFSNTLTDLNG